TLTAARAGLVTLFAGLVLWRITTHWGRPPPETLVRLISVTVVATAGLILVIVLGARRLALVPADPRFDVAGAALIVGALGAREQGSDPLVRFRELLASRRGELIGLALALVLLAIPVLRFISLEQILGFDESIYAATSRSWLLGTPNSAWSSDRSPGISVLGLPIAWSGWDAGLRLIGLGFGLGAVVAGWALARRFGGPAAGVLAALLIAAVPGLQLNAGLFLTDVPSAALILAAMMVMWWQLEERARPDRGLLLLAPLVAAAFYLRYGSVIPVLFLSATALILWAGRLLTAWRLTVATVGLLFLLLVPYLVQSTLTHGDPLAIFLSAQSLASPAYPGEALAHYWRLLPSELAGVVGAWFLILGILAWPMWMLVRGRRDRRVRAQTFLMLPALGQLVLLGIVALPQVRYVLLPVMLILIAGSVSAVDLGRLLSHAWRRTLLAGVVISIVVTAIGSAAVMMRLQAEVTPLSAHLVDAARRIRDDAAGRSCAILGYPPPELVWYSGCAAHHFGYPPIPGRETALSGERRYLILSPFEFDREPAGTLREDYLALAEPEPFAIVPNRVTGDPALEVYRLMAPD
ncbi:MAG: ArnT family glycosyltransferase, partial [Candidatus Limnocylindria bacterium]